MAKTPAKKSSKAPAKAQSARQAKQAEDFAKKSKASKKTIALKTEFEGLTNSLTSYNSDQMPANSERTGTAELLSRMALVRSVYSLVKPPASLGEAGLKIVPEIVMDEALTVGNIRTLALQFGVTIAREHGGGRYPCLANEHSGQAFMSRWEAKKPTVIEFAGAADGGTGTTGMGRVVWRHMEGFAEKGDKTAKGFLQLLDDGRAFVSGLFQEPLKPGRATIQLADIDDESAPHGDGEGQKRFVCRTVHFVSAGPAEKRVLFGVAPDGRVDPKKLLSPSYYWYLGDLVLQSGQTYVGDAVAMGGHHVAGGAKGARSAFVHKVTPAADDQVAIVVDWVRA